MNVAGVRFLAGVGFFIKTKAARRAAFVKH